MAPDVRRTIEAALDGFQRVSRDQYLAWTSHPDLATRARAYAFSATAWDRIVPEPSMQEQCTFMARYLLQCVVDSPTPDAFLHSGFGAAHELAAWIKHLATMPGTEGVISTVLEHLAQTYKASNTQTRERIETGALEHMLESPALRVSFEPWGRDPILAAPYTRALQWGRAHSDPTRET